MKKKKIIFTAGGTGGHLFPAQAAADELGECDILFVSGRLKENRYFDRSRFAYKEISVASMSLNPLKTIKGFLSIVQGVRQSIEIFREFQPELVVGFGSFFTLPVLIAAKMKKVPILLHEQNAVPGKINRLFSRFSKVVAIAFPEASLRLKGRIEETQFPLRKQTKVRKGMSGLVPDKPTLLIFGGSQGAVKLNSICLKAASSLTHFQIIHFTGNEKSADEAKKTYEKLKIFHHVKSFEPDIFQALMQADVVISRAGAATIHELMEFEKPALLIPFPFATENHQIKNAHHFVHRVQGGIMCEEKKLDEHILVRQIESLFHDRLEKKKKIQEYKEKKQLRSLSHLIKSVIHE